MLKVSGAVIAMSYTCHLFACGWYYFGDDDAPDGLAPQLGWISRQHNTVWNATGDRAEVGLSTKYITAYYWAITTISTVGFGDITGETDAERLYSIVAEMFGSLMFAILIGTLGSMMVQNKLLEEKVDKQLCVKRRLLITPPLRSERIHPPNKHLREGGKGGEGGGRGRALQYTRSTHNCTPQ